jgi:hypothetical protein
VEIFECANSGWRIELQSGQTYLRSDRGEPSNPATLNVKGLLHRVHPAFQQGPLLLFANDGAAVGGFAANIDGLVVVSDTGLEGLALNVNQPGANCKISESDLGVVSLDLSGGSDHRNIGSKILLSQCRGASISVPSYGPEVSLGLIDCEFTDGTINKPDGAADDLNSTFSNTGQTRYDGARLYAKTTA